MKKTILMLAMLGVISCGEKQEELRIFMWTDNIPVDVYEDFEKETGIKIIEDAVSSNEEIYAKVKSSGGGYDIIAPSLDYASIMMSEGLLAQIDPSLIPNLTNIDPNIMRHVLEIDPNNEYIFPFAFGPTVIAYDETLVSDPIESFDIFSNPKYAGKMMLLNDMREVMGSAFGVLGYPVDTTNAVALQKVEQLLREWKNNIIRFDSDAFQLAYASGEVNIVHGYPDSIIPALTEEKRENTKFVVPDKGGMIWLDNLLVLNNAPNKEAAIKFIDFIHRPDIYARIMDYIESLSINVPARDLMELESIIDYADIENTTMLNEISDEILQIHSRIWENVQAQ